MGESQSRAHHQNVSVESGQIPGYERSYETAAGRVYQGEGGNTERSRCGMEMEGLDRVEQRWRKRLANGTSLA